MTLNKLMFRLSGKSETLLFKLVCFCPSPSRKNVVEYFETFLSVYFSYNNHTFNTQTKCTYEIKHMHCCHQYTPTLVSQYHL